MVSEQVSTELSQAEQQRQVDAVDWFHSYEIVPGVFSRGPSDMVARGQYFPLPADLSGKRVLDIGTADGYFAFLAEERGAEVLAIDTWPREGFFVAHRLRHSQVEFRQMSLYDLDPADVGMFDLVLCFGVYYHLKKPISAMERIARVAKDLVLLESEVVAPNAALGFDFSLFHESDEWLDDPTNWWIPTTENFLSTVRAAGFPRAELVNHYDDTRTVIRAEKGPLTQGKVRDEDLFIAIDHPERNQFIQPGEPIDVRGWTVSQLHHDQFALDQPTQSGIHVYVYLDKLDVPAAQLGQAEYPITRADIAKAYGARYTASGYKLVWTPPTDLAGRHTLYVLVDTPTGWNMRAVPVWVGEPSRTPAGPSSIDVVYTHLNNLLRRNELLERRLRGYETGRVFRAAAALLRLFGRPLP